MKMGAFILAYHGCDRQVAEELLSGRSKFLQSKNDYDWLGHGTYFWENNPQRALEWAKFLASRRKRSDQENVPYAVGAIIDLGNCLDLTESASLAVVRSGYDSFLEIVRSSGGSPPKNTGVSTQDHDRLLRKLDCPVINHVHDLIANSGQVPYSTVRGAFMEGGELYPGAGFQAKTHVQICVRDLGCIRGVFRIEGIDP